MDFEFTENNEKQNTSDSKKENIHDINNNMEFEFVENNEEQNTSNNKKESFHNVNESKSFIRSFICYLKNGLFKKDVSKMAKTMNVPPKRVAETFIGKFFGVISDVLDIALTGIKFTVYTLIDLLNNILLKGADIIFNVATGLTRILTGNKCFR